MLAVEPGSVLLVAVVVHLNLSHLLQGSKLSEEGCVVSSHSASSL